MEAGGDEVSVVRLKPLEDLLVGKRFEGNEDGQQKQHPLIIADSWIGRVSTKASKVLLLT